MGAGLNDVIFDDLSNTNPGFKVTVSNISKTVRFRDKVTKEH